MAVKALTVTHTHSNQRLLACPPFAIFFFPCFPFSLFHGRLSVGRTKTSMPKICTLFSVDLFLFFLSGPPPTPHPPIHTHTHTHTRTHTHTTSKAVSVNLLWASPAPIERIMLVFHVCPAGRSLYDERGCRALSHATLCFPCIP